MTDNQLYTYNNLMSDGKYRQGRAESYEYQTYYLDAKNEYYYAAQAYESAMRLAREGNDYSREMDAYRAMSYCQKQFSEMGYKQWQKEQDYKKNDPYGRGR